MKNLYYLTLYASLTLAVSAAVIAPIFRCTWYWDIPVETGQPYGGADILELLLHFLLIGGASVASLQGIGIILTENTRREFGIKVLVFALLTGALGVALTRWAWLSCGP